MQLTKSQKPTEVTREWYVVDATDLPLGRLSSEIALRLRGKHKPSYTSHVDGGDNIIVINAEKVKLTGRKWVQNIFYWHTNFPGGIKQEIAEHTRDGKHAERLVQRGVQRMMPKSKLGRAMFSKLHVYTGSEHPHTAQKPQALDLGAVIAKGGKK
jgi:large subunit ribosomal protein L13